MYKKIILVGAGCFLLVVICGCAVRTYPVIRDRVDQDLTTGNRGYLVGEAKVSEEKPRKTTRQIQIFELEMPHPKRVKEKTLLPKPGISPDILVLESKTKKRGIPSIKPIVVKPVDSSGKAEKGIVLQEYKVRKGDTLQSISKKFYGTTKRWTDIYKANKDILKSPNKIYPGQVIKIPVEKMAGEGFVK